MFKLRELSRNDLATINSWRTDRETIACLGAPFRYIDREVDEAWFDSYLKNRSTTIRCVAIDADDPTTPLCLATLASINWVDRNCVFHIQVSPSSRSKGVGSFAIEGMLNHAFYDLGLNRIELEVLESNERAQHLYKKAGFVVEGCKRQAVFKNGSFFNMLEMGLLRDEWKGIL